MQNPNEIAEVWRKELAEAFSSILTLTLSGSEVPKKRYLIWLELPVPLGEAIEKVAVAQNQPLETILGNMATHGFQRSLQEQMGEVPQKKQELTGLQEIPGLENLSKRLEGLKGFMGQLNSLKEAIEHAATAIGADNPGETKENSGQPPISSR